MDSKKRAPNFTNGEESLLVEFVSKYRDIIECKKTDTTSHVDKMNAWAKIEVEFNGTSGTTYRSKEVLRKKYENLKKRVKNKVGDEKCYIRGTGGGPPMAITLSNVESNLKEILGIRVDGVLSEFDDDAVDSEFDKDVETEVQVVVEVPQGEILENKDLVVDVLPNSNNKEDQFDVTLQPGTSQQEDDFEAVPINFPVADSWRKYNPAMLKKKKSEQLQVPKISKKMKTSDTKMVTDRISQWAAAKTKLENSKECYLQEEHELKLQCIKQKHEQDMRISEKKAELELQQMSDEHNLKMEILLLEKKLKEKRLK